MKWITNITKPKPLSFIIKKEILYNMTDNKEVVAYYLYVYDESGFCFFDDMQDTLQWAKTVALEDFHVPMDAWKQVE